MLYEGKKVGVVYILAFGNDRRLGMLDETVRLSRMSNA